MSIRRFDVQAKLALASSLLSAVGLAGLVWLIARNFQSELGAIVFGASSKYSLIFMGGCGGTMLLAVVGLALGFSSAGERRNEFQRGSWLGFFIGTAVLSGSIICFAMFYLLQLKHQ